MTIYIILAVSILILTASIIFWRLSKKNLEQAKRLEREPIYEEDIKGNDRKVTRIIERVLEPSGAFWGDEYTEACERVCEKLFTKLKRDYVKYINIKHTTDPILGVEMFYASIDVLERKET